MANLLKLAKIYRDQLKWSVIPIDAKSKKCVVSWKEYQTRFATDSELKEWFEGYAINNDNRGMALVTGSISQVVVIDIDDKTGETFGYSSSMKAESGGGGLHFYYRWNDKNPINNMAKVNGEPVDVRGEGGYIILPPSKHPSGGCYKWKMKDLKQGFEQMQKFDLHFKEEKQKETKKKLPLKVDEGSRNNTLYRYGCSLVNKYCPVDVKAMMSGVNQGYNPPLGAEELEVIYQQVMKREIQVNIGRSPISMKQELEVRREAEKKAPSTGYHQLDDIIKGFMPSHLYTFTGETNAGKTTMAVNFAYHVSKQKRNVLYIALEPDYQILPMLACLFAKRKYSTMQNDDVDKIENINILLQDDCQTYEQLERIIERSKNMYELIIIDHIGYFVSGGDNYIQEQSKLLKQIALITKKSKTATMIIAHPKKREKTKAVIRMDDISGSSAFKQDSTEVLILHREIIEEEDGNINQSMDGWIYVGKTKVSSKSSSNRAKIYFTEDSPKVTGGSPAEQMLGNI